MISTLQIGWIAGLLEGEGSFGLFGKAGKTKTVRIALGMTDADTIQRAREILQKSATIHTVDRDDGTRKVSYMLFIHGNSAIQWLMTLYPLMSSRRREKFRECLDYWRTRRRWRSRFV